MGSSTISDQEFERLHNQMLELKSQNYVLEDRCRRQEIEMSKERQRLETLEKEVNKYQNLAKLNPLAFAKSFQLNKNKDKEQREKETVDQLQLENEHLQYKIQLQEDEFRLTNETLREEIVRLVKHNETLNLQLRLPNETNDPKESADRVDSTMSNIQNKIKEIELIQRPDTLGSNSQLSYAVLKEKEQLESRLSEMSGKLTQMEETNRQLIEDAKELIQSKTEKIALEQEFENLKRHNHEIDKARTEQNETFQKLERERTEFRELAEKRHMLIDELRSEVEEMAEKLDAHTKESEKRLATTKLELNKEIGQLKNERKDFLCKIEELNEKLTRLEHVEQQNVLLTQQIEQIKKDVEEQKVDRLLLEQMKVEHAQRFQDLTEEHEKKLNETSREIELLQSEIYQKSNEIKQLKQSLEDQIEERKIHEKRGVMYVRELKKQLNNEKKQKERLQEKFGDLLSEMPLDVSSQSFETTSVGSWSFLSSSKEANGKKKSGSLSIQSGSEERELSNGSSDQINVPESASVNGNQPQSQVLEQENTMLVARITQLQQEKWMLEERLNQLTILNEEISNELQNKQKIISFYCMERRSEPRINSPSNDKFTVKKVVDFIKDKGDDNLKEINRKLQRMLEETLIKNMHLQTNLETLSRQIHEQTASSS